MIHGILQFTPSIAFRCVLHRCESRDIRCRESLHYYLYGACPIDRSAPMVFRRDMLFSLISLGTFRAGCLGEIGVRK